MQNTVHQGRIICKIVNANEMIRPGSCQWEAEQTSFDIWRRKRPENLTFIRMNCQKNKYWYFEQSGDLFENSQRGLG